jgi:hypothetical protein
MNPKARIRVAVLAVAACLLGILAAAPLASADLKFEETSVSMTSPGGAYDHHAGSHPDFRFTFKVERTSREVPGGQYTGPAESVHDVVLDLPPGLLGNPNAMPKCSAQDFFIPETFGTRCGTSTQIGTVRVLLHGWGNRENPLYRPLFNLEPGPNRPALFGFNYLGIPSYVKPGIRPDDYGISSGSFHTAQIDPIQEVVVTLWGVPADHSHDTERAVREINNISGQSIPSDQAPVPFFRNPTSCSETPSTLTARGDSWENPGIFDVAPMTVNSWGVPLRFEGCEVLPFAPTMSAHPTEPAADSPSGFTVDIVVPQNESPNGYSTSDVRKVVTTLPKGMTVSASSASGLGSCSPTEIGIGSNDPPTCPDSSKLGTVTIDTPLLDEQLQGPVYLAKQNDNPFNSLLALYLAVKGPGFYLKLPGKIDADPKTGQLTATFNDTPQLPFEHLRLEMKSGPRAPLTMPKACGTYSVKTEFVPWSGSAPVVDESTFGISDACGSDGFSPKLHAGTREATAGGSSPFTLQVTRKDGEQNLAALDVTLPEGLLAKLKGVTVCGGGEAASGNCPAASQVGRTTVGAGSGPTPIYVPEAGKAPTAVYLAGPYKGAPYSLVVKVPAQAGPFDLGTVAVRSGIYIDPVTTQVSVKSDRLPQILQGIPIAYRDVRVEVDRPGFMVNPTSCKGMKVTSTIAGAEGASANPTAPFAAANCARLGFKPKLALRLSGAPTHRGGHPALKAVLTMPNGGANIGRAQVTLPKTEFLENAHIRTICTRVQYAANNCPKASVYGFAKAWSPLLDRPLEGPIYLRSSSHTLPDLVASLDGQIHVDLSGRISSANRRIRNTFDFVPDAPVSKFVLKMQGGQKGLIVNNAQLCRAKGRAEADFTGQNGKRSLSQPLVKVAGCGGKKK